MRETTRSAVHRSASNRSSDVQQTGASSPALYLASLASCARLAARLPHPPLRVLDVAGTGVTRRSRSSFFACRPRLSGRPLVLLFNSRLLLELRRLVLAVSFPIAVRADRSEPVAIDDRRPFTGFVRVPEHCAAAISAHQNARVAFPAPPHHVWDRRQQAPQAITSSAAPCAGEGAIDYGPTSRARRPRSGTQRRTRLRRPRRSHSCNRDLCLRAFAPLDAPGSHEAPPLPLQERAGKRAHRATGTRSTCEKGINLGTNPPSPRSAFAVMSFLTPGRLDEAGGEPPRSLRVIDAMRTTVGSKLGASNQEPVTESGSSGEGSSPRRR
jgi:hypothetical protein